MLGIESKFRRIDHIKRCLELEVLTHQSHEHYRICLPSNTSLEGGGLQDILDCLAELQSYRAHLKHIKSINITVNSEQASVYSFEGTLKALK